MTSNPEVIKTSKTQIAEFTEFESKLAVYKDRYENVVYALDDPDQEKQAKVDRLAIGKVITSLDKAHRIKKRPLKEKVDLLDYERKRIKDQLLEIQDNVKSQIANHQLKIKEANEALALKAEMFKELRRFEFSPTIEQVEQRLAQINDTEIDESYGNMKATAALNKMESLQILEPMLEKLREYAEQEEETKRLRIEAEAKARKKREKEIQKEAEEKAKKAIEVERKAKVKAEKDAKIAAEKAKRDAEEAAEIARKTAEAVAKKAEQEKRDAIRKAQEEVKLKAEQEEKKRLDAIKKEQEEVKRREANKKHRGAVKTKAMKALIDETGLTRDQARSVITAIAASQIPSITISY